MHDVGGVGDLNPLDVWEETLELACQGTAEERRALLAGDKQGGRFDVADVAVAKRWEAGP